MSAPVRVQIGADAAALDLWRLAETDDTARLEEILARGADIDARNVDGVTALMRAAYTGRLKMVRTLIGHGADLNATRVDGFTALGLAAFFGHTDVVKVLVESGADLSQATRFSTSAEMWASARSFYEIARYLEQARSSVTEFSSTPYSPGDGSEENLLPAEPVAAERPTPVEPDPAPEPPRLVYYDQSPSEEREEDPETALTRERVEPLVVRTLKDPPEIWDLVHETPPQFNPGGAFVARLTSTKTKLMVLTLALLFVASLAVFGVMKLRDGARNGVVNVQVSQESGTTQIESASQTSASAPVSASANTSTNIQQSGENTLAAPTVPLPTDIQSDSKAFAAGIRMKRVRATSRLPNTESNSSPIGAEIGTATGDTSAQRQSPETAALKESNEKSSNDSASASKRSNTNLSPQLIALPNPSVTPKAKVIQWP